MKITVLTPALAAILGLALASAPVTVQAQTPAATPAPATAKPAKVKKTNYMGTLTAIDTTANTITVATSKKDPSKTLTLSISSTAKIQKDKKAATLADFTVGEKVAGAYVTDASGTLTASSLNDNFKVKAASTTKPAATTSAPAATPASTTPPAAQ